MSVETARRALQEYIEVVVIDERNPQGEPLRDALFAASDAGQRERARDALRREAALWGPGTPEWRSLESDGGTLYAGRLARLYGEVLVSGDGEIAHAVVSLD